MRRIVSCFFVMCVMFPAHAIVNIEGSRPGVGDEGVTGELDLKGYGTFGNTEKMSVSLKNTTFWHRSSGVNFLIMSYLYGESLGVKDQNQAFLHLRHVEGWTPKWSWELFTQLQSDEFRRLNWRYLAGGGLRHQVYETQRGSFYAGIGAFYSQEDLEHEGTLDPQTEETARGNFYLSFQHGFENSLTYVGALYFQPRYDRFKDYHVLWDNSLKAKMSELLSLLVELKVAHDNEPPEAVESTDVTTLIGFQMAY